MSFVTQRLDIHSYCPVTPVRPTANCWS